MTYYNSIPLNVMNDPRWARRYTVQDAPRLREIRKKLDAESPQDEVDTVSLDLLHLCITSTDSRFSRETACIRVARRGYPACFRLHRKYYRSKGLSSYLILPLGSRLTWSISL